MGLIERVNSFLDVRVEVLIDKLEVGEMFAGEFGEGEKLRGVEDS